ncbi:hypothetical protein CGRA01v4_11109 [Colletotrichum graminicola]|uniref:Metallo-beta-lactamase domain-containing protein n=1 Tax=Colletotrichum graminicola (strain M1.001 / M2 / FGSC 10212) TaxID=645133 RepID=E3QKX3_COLGM|nr:uncharacterized protein GLRG_06655 [Colletotrichum graminicola M1.001]EFQ31511.1 hypothetical protein GLRG_06655 [Colletotrichum graminicola M1.001]WDK19822.1 hypothetical protein CGRA01v4_11109 [Colletotrichum graminicola]
MDRAKLIDTLASAQSSPKRPILTLMNGDTTWLVSVPRPAGTKGKAFYHILVDPWLEGHAEVGFGWVVRLQLKEKAALDSIEAIEDWIREIETVCGTTDGEHEQWLDAVLVTHANLDHLHKPTLRTLSKSAQVLAVQEAATMISSMDHFENIIAVPDFVPGEEWPATPDMPGSLSIFRLQSKGDKYTNLCHAVIIGIPTEDGKSEAILYTPHGVEPEAVEAVRKANSDASFLAMLHPLNKAGTMGFISRGVAEGLRIERENSVRHWVNTHDDNISFSGVLSYIMRYGRATLEQGLKQEAREKVEEQRRPDYIVVENGGSHILT